MRALHLLLSLYFFDFGKQIFLDCDPAGDMAPCMPDNTCPNTSWTCIAIQGNISSTTCCDNSFIIQLWNTSSTITSTSTTPITTMPCVDKVNPATGVSDCPNRQYLCNVPLYYTLMTEQCPKTCNRCPEPSTPQPTAPTCLDLVNYQTGISDCPQRRYLCTNIIYLDLMRQQCPKTCGYC